jgi:signal transduction histidine kinase
LNFTELVEEGVEEWRSQLEEKGLTLHTRLTEKDLMVNADPERLSWAINNLLENAYNYTQTGGVEVILAEAGHEARLDITDTGVGISVEDQSYLFTKFFRATPHKELYQVAGVGLGLFITRSLIEAHNGQVQVESQLEIGSTFSLTLPLLK